MRSELVWIVKSETDEKPIRHQSDFYLKFINQWENFFGNFRVANDPQLRENAIDFDFIYTRQMERTKRV